MKNNVFDLLQTRIISHYQAAEKILNGGMPSPRTAILYPTYICNQACPGCEYQDDNNNINALMSKSQLFNSIDQLVSLGIKGLEFCGGGEPTLHPDFNEAILRLRKKNISIGLLTNGTKLNGKLAETIVKELSYVRISLDSSNEKIFNLVKRPKSDSAGFDMVISNIKQLVILREQYNTGLTISVKYLISKENLSGIDKAVELAAGLGVDSIQFKSLRIFSNAISEVQGEAVERKIERLRKQYPSLAIIGGVKKLNVTMKCWMSPVQIMVDALGDVFICCYYRHRKNKHSFGNLFTKPLKDIWYSKEHKKAIDGIKIPECNVLDCRFANYNKIMQEMMVENKAQFDFI